MKKIRLYTGLKGDTYYIIDKLSKEIYATAATPVLAEIIRKSLEDYMNSGR